MTSTNPQRIQLSRAKGFNLQAASISLNGLPAVKCDRSTKWGNRWRVWKDFDGQWHISWDSCHYEVESKKDGLIKAVELFEEMATKRGPHHFSLDPIPTPEDARRELHGKNLACWCGLGELCHVDIWLRLANV